MDTTQSHQLFKRACHLIPGGVNSPVRAFGSVGGNPLFIQKASGAHIYDVDGNQYIDYVASWGPMILGHALPEVLEAVELTVKNGLSFGAPNALEVDLADLVCELTGVEMIRMVNSGTEAVMSAIRLARGVTGRDKLIKFEGCYHGHSDSMLINAGSGLLTQGTPSSAGVTQGAVADTLTAEFNDLNSVEALFKEYADQIAAIIIEPVAANMGVIAPNQNFLAGLRSLCDQYGALLIFDEVITGFRLALGGAQEYFDVKADLVTYGKIIGGGLPVGAYGGKKHYMQKVAPTGPVYQAGTLSGNPVAMAAGLSQLQALRDRSDVLYPELEKRGRELAQSMRDSAQEHKFPLQVNQIGSLCCAFFAEQAVTSFATATLSDVQKYAVYFNAMLEQGIYLAPSQYEAMFIGAMHTEEIIEQTKKTFHKALAACI